MILLQTKVCPKATISHFFTGQTMVDHWQWIPLIMLSILAFYISYWFFFTHPNININIPFLGNFTSKNDFNQYHPNNIYFVKLTFQIKISKHKSRYTKLTFDQNQFYKIMLIQNQVCKLQSKHTLSVWISRINYKYNHFSL